MHYLLFLFSFVSISIQAMPHYGAHKKALHLPHELKQAITHLDCDCELPKEHFCGSYALIHALMVEKYYGLRDDQDPYKKLSKSFTALGINSAKKELV